MARIQGRSIRVGVKNFSEGGTGQSTWNKGDILICTAKNTLAKLPIGTEGQKLAVQSTGLPGWQSDYVSVSIGDWVITTDGDDLVFKESGTKMMKLKKTTGDLYIRGAVIANNRGGELT